MPTRVSFLPALLLIMIAVAGCEGERGPAGPTGPVGPAGPPGPGVIICFGEIDGFTSTVASFWPDDVTVEVIAGMPGVWTVSLSGTFPAEKGNLLVTVSDDHVNINITGYITEWTATSITCGVAMWNISSGTFTNGKFSFVVLGQGV